MRRINPKQSIGLQAIFSQLWAGGLPLYLIFTKNFQ